MSGQHNNKKNPTVPKANKNSPPPIPDCHHFEELQLLGT